MRPQVSPVHPRNRRESMGLFVVEEIVFLWPWRRIVGGSIVSGTWPASPRPITLSLTILPIRRRTASYATVQTPRAKGRPEDGPQQNRVRRATDPIIVAGQQVNRQRVFQRIMSRDKGERWPPGEVLRRLTPATR